MVMSSTSGVLRCKIMVQIQASGGECLNGSREDR